MNTSYENGDKDCDTVPREENNVDENTFIWPLYDDQETEDLKNAAVTYYTGQADNEPEPSLNLYNLQTVSLNREISGENFLSSNSRDNKDIINAQVIKTPSPMFNFSYNNMLDNVNFFVSPDNYINHASKSESSAPRKKQFSAKSMRPCRCKLKCGKTFSTDDRNVILQTFYDLGNHELQWQFIAKYVISESVKKRQIIRSKNRNQTLSYYLPLQGEKIRVCKLFFLNTLRVSEQMVYTAIKKNYSNTDKTDNRGKHDNRPRKMAVSTEESIISHIQLFPTNEVHFNMKSSEKKYLSETLNISKMYRLYTNWCHAQANARNFDVKMPTRRQYETVFHTKFNLTFFHSRKDVCSTCMIYEQADNESKQSLKDKYSKHMNNNAKIREIKTSEMENLDSHSTLATFDFEKVLGVPQSKVEIFYYKRKYPVYNFVVFDASRKIGYCYMWHGQIAKSGSIEIGSCLYNFIEEQYHNQINKISFYSNGCAGQNKNQYVFALYLFAVCKFKLEITQRFFESGHSQIADDSKHACIERALKNKIIYTPDQLYSTVINAKKIREKYQVKEMSQTDFYDIKGLIAGHNWLINTKGDKIYWSKIKEIRVSSTNPQSVYYKYDYDDDFMELDITSTSIKTGKLKSATNETTSTISDMILIPAYNGPVPIPKALHEDLQSLCRLNAIPTNYHSFYNSLICSNNETIQDDDSETECNETDNLFS